MIFALRLRKSFARRLWCAEFIDGETHSKEIGRLMCNKHYCYVYDTLFSMDSSNLPSRLGEGRIGR